MFSQFLHCYAQRYPKVQVEVMEGSGLEILAMLERGEVHLGQMLPYAVPLDAGRFASQLLEPAELLAACQPKLTLGKHGGIDIARLAPHPLLLLDGGYGLRRASTPPVAWQGSSRTFGYQAARRIPCSPLLKPGTALPLLPRLFARSDMT